MSPDQRPLEEIDYREAIVETVVVGRMELAVAPAEDLRLLLKKHIASGVADPERGIGVDVHLGTLEARQQVLVVLEDFEHLLHFPCRREGIAAVTVLGEKFVVDVIAEGFAIHYLYGLAVALAKHFHEYATLSIGSLADTDVARCNIVHILVYKALFQRSLLSRQGNDFTRSPIVSFRFHIFCIFCLSRCCVEAIGITLSYKKV